MALHRDGLRIRPCTVYLPFDHQVDGGEVLVVAPRLSALDADEVGAGGVDPDGIPPPRLGSGLEVHVEGGFQHHVPRQVGQLLLAHLDLSRDEEMYDHVLQRLVRIDVGEHPLDTDRLAGLGLQDRAWILARLGRRLVDEGGLLTGRSDHVEVDLGVLGPTR